MDIDGKDLMDLGFEEGHIIGEILEYLLEGNGKTRAK